LKVFWPSSRPKEAVLKLKNSIPQWEGDLSLADRPPNFKTASQYAKPAGDGDKPLSPGDDAFERADLPEPTDC
jgi:hypothetical protein